MTSKITLSLVENWMFFDKKARRWGKNCRHKLGCNIADMCMGIKNLKDITRSQCHF